MKKIVLLTLVLAALILSLASCSDGSGAGIGGGSFNAVGTWKNVRPTLDERFVFKSDKTYEHIDDGKTLWTGTWDYAESWDHTSYGIVFITFQYAKNVYCDYDPATKELVLSGVRYKKI